MFIAYPGRSYQVTDTLVSGHIVANKSIASYRQADDQDYTALTRNFTFINAMA